MLVCGVRWQWRGQQRQRLYLYPYKEAMMLKNQQCGTCKFFHPGPPGAGTCRRMPPRVMLLPKASLVPGQQRMELTPVLPMRESRDVGCGEYRPDMEVGSSGQPQEN